jgi:signal transduction histidine kinase
VSFLLEVRDISLQKGIEQERERLLESERAARSAAERASRVKDEFLTVLSHELRTPLTAILGWASMLRAGRVDAGRAAWAAEIIERNARAEAKLVDDLLDVSSIAAGKVRIDARRVEPAEILQAAVDSFRPAAEAKRVRLEVACDRRAGPILADPGRIPQVVGNLLSNAIKFTPEGGCVCVTLCRAGSCAEIVVRDTGEGIAPDFLPHVFEPFCQADSSWTRRHGGLGLGLALVRHLVELHGGTVRAQSDGEGRGATFIVTLPCAPDACGEALQPPS